MPIYQLYGAVAICVIIECIINILWATIDPLVPADITITGLQTYTTCISQDSSYLFEAISIFYKALLLVYCVFLAISVC